MFDGNHRSRRVVNLSGKRKTKDKKTVLEQSRLQRAQRQMTAQRIAAAVRIQSRARGGSTRQRLAANWWEQHSLPIVERTRVVNAWLGLMQRRTGSHSNSMGDTTTDSVEILRSFAKQLQESAPVKETSPSARSIVMGVMQHFKSLSLNEMQDILCYVVDLRGNQSKDFMDTDTLNKDSNYYWNRIGSTSFGLMGELVCDPPTTEIQQFLYNCIRLSVAPDSTEGSAMLALLSVVIGNSDTNSIPQLVSGLHSMGVTDTPLGRSVHQVLTRHCAMILNAAADRFRKDPKESTFASHFITLFKLIALDGVGNGSSLTRIKLLWGLNRLVKGETVDEVTETMDKPVVEIDSDDEQEEDEGKPSSKTETASKTTSRAMREELRTIQKLDRVNAANVESMDAWYSNTKVVVQGSFSDLTDPSLWVLLGDALLSPISTDESSIIEYTMVLSSLLQGTTGLEPRQNASRSHLLNTLAFSTKVLEPLWRFLSRRLTKDYGVRYHTELLASLSLFCDIFAHANIALRDENFLEKYTTFRRTTASVPIIQVDDVIQKLNPVLFDLYWSNPVLASHLKLVFGKNGTPGLGLDSLPVVSQDSHHNSVRARLLLSGTKLWNSLYNRWARLVRSSPFCDESVWWFPPITTLSSEGAVAQQNETSGVVPMDIDSEDDDDSMDSEEKEEEVDENSVLADAFRDPKMARVLASVPQVVPFTRRVKLFHSLLQHEKLKGREDDAEVRLRMLALFRGDDGPDGSRAHVTIRRDKLFDDSMSQLNELGVKLKKRVQVTFVNQHGTEEAGIDGGGVFKEFIDDVIKDAFSTTESTASHQFFTVTPLQTLTVNPDLTKDYSLFPHYEFLGRVLGKAVFESILVDPQFCLPFLNQFLGKSNSIEDLKNLDLEFYRNLTKLLSLSEDELVKLGLTFETTIGSGASARSVELCRNGSTMTVTKRNVIQYIHILSHHKLNVESSLQTRAFLKGFRDLIPPSWVRLFSAYELQKLISGDDSISGIDVQALKRAMQYGGGYHPSQPIIQRFWEVVEEMTPDQQNKLLKFMTSCSRQPLLGFESLQPLPCIQQIRLQEAIYSNGDAERRAPLPTSSTCMNLLKLPNYKTKELLRTKILRAIEAGAGFELT